MVTEVTLLEHGSHFGPIRPLDGLSVSSDEIDILEVANREQGIIRVDGQSYTWFGAPLDVPGTVTQNSFEYTSTKSIFSLSVGTTVGLKVTFLSPVTPSDNQRQSIAASYMNVEVVSLDGKEHDVQLYTDVSAGM